MTSDATAASGNRQTARQIANTLLAQIDAGDLPAGHRAPTVRQIKQDYGVSMGTAQGVMRQLRASGAVTNRPNAVAYVRDRTADTDTASEVRTIAAELADVRDTVDQAKANLADLEERLTRAAGRLGERPG